MRSSAVLRCASKVWFGALFALLFAARTLYAQGGEPQDFAIRGARVVPVSGAPLENATVVISRGIITAVGKEANIPAEAWVIDGKGLTVYPGLFDSFTDVGIRAAPPASAEGAPRRPQEGSRGPEDRPVPRRGAARPTKSASTTNASKRGAARDSRPSFPRPRADSSPGRPPCSIWRVNAPATWW